LERRAGISFAAASSRLRLRRVCAPGGGGRGIAGRKLVSSWLDYRDLICDLISDLIIVTQIRLDFRFRRIGASSSGHGRACPFGKLRAGSERGRRIGRSHTVTGDHKNGMGIGLAIFGGMG
jgi:hypothetical protein